MEEQEPPPPQAAKTMLGMAVFVGIILILMCGVGAGIWVLVRQALARAEAQKEAAVTQQEEAEQARREALGRAGNKPETPAGDTEPTHPPEPAPAEPRQSSPAIPPTAEVNPALEVPPHQPPAAEEQPARLALKITGIFPQRQPLAASPWYEHGGTWTYLELAVAGNAKPTMVVGLSAPEAETQDVILSPVKNLAAQPFLTALADGFHTELPAERRGEPRRMLRLVAHQMAANQQRQADGSYAPRGGDWVTTRWVLGNEIQRTEVLFSFSRIQRQAVLEATDNTQRGMLLGLLCDALRDGPLPPRSERTDPTLQATGPTFSDWKVLEDGISFAATFSGDSRQVAWIGRGAADDHRLRIAWVDGQAPTTSWEPGGLWGDVQAQGPTGFLTARQGKNEDEKATRPVFEYWLKTAPDGEFKRLPGATGLAAVWPAQNLAAADGRYIGIFDPPEKNAAATTQSLKLRLIDLQFLTPNPMTVTLPGKATVLHWATVGGKPVVYAEEGAPSLTTLGSKRYRVEVETGKVTSQAAWTDAGWLIAPDNRHKAYVNGNQWIRIVDLAGGKPGAWRQLNFSPYEHRAQVDFSRIKWVTSRYLLLPRVMPELIDAQTGKIVVPMGADNLSTMVLDISPDFKWVVALRGNQVCLGKVNLPAE